MYVRDAALGLKRISFERSHKSSQFPITRVDLLEAKLGLKKIYLGP